MFLSVISKCRLDIESLNPELEKMWLEFQEKNQEKNKYSLSSYFAFSIDQQKYCPRRIVLLCPITASSKSLMCQLGGLAYLNRRHKFLFCEKKMIQL